jgi:hypothetical protein
MDKVRQPDGGGGLDSRAGRRQFDAGVIVAALGCDQKGGPCSLKKNELS